MEKIYEKKVIILCVAGMLNHIIFADILTRYFKCYLDNVLLCVVFFGY